MSEVIDEAYHPVLGHAHLVAHPGPEFSQALERFMSPDMIRRLGGRAIGLRSESSLLVKDGPPQFHRDIRRKNISKAELAQLSQGLNDRQSSVQPHLASDVGLYPYPNLPNLKDNERGIGLRFKLILDRLTRQVLRETVLVNPEDESLPVHFRLYREQMVLGNDLRLAHQNLVDLLQQQKPYMIQSMYLSPDFRI